jgi:hypothetical protein
MTFSLVQGGPLFQFFVRTRLSTIALGWLKRRIITLSMLTWLPLLVLTMLSGQALDGGLKIPFLYYLEAHVRFLLSLPLLLLTELVAHRKLLPLVLHFIDRGIVTAETRPRFEAYIASALRLRNSMFIEIALLAFVLSIVLVRRGDSSYLHLVCSRLAIEIAVIARRLLVRLLQSAIVSISRFSLVVPDFHLDPVPLANFASGSLPGVDAS